MIGLAGKHRLGVMFFSTTSSFFLLYGISYLLLLLQTPLVMESWLNLTVASYGLSAMWYATSSGNFPADNHKLLKNLSCSGLSSTTCVTAK